MRGLFVRDVMTRDVRSVPLDAPIIVVAQKMAQERISCIVVCDGRLPVGVISERDTARLLADVLESGAPDCTPADVMSKPVVTTQPMTQTALAMREMMSRKIRRLVVVSDAGHLLGIVTQTDLMRAQVAELEEHSEVLEAEVAKRTADLVDAAKELEATNSARAEFLATMSHEIRTPLNGILGTVALMLDMELGDEPRDYLATVESSGRMLLAILNDVLDLSKIDAGQLTIDEDPFDVRVVAKDVSRLLGARALERGNAINIRVADDFPEAVLGDAVRMQQVMQNLVSNAIKFTEHGWIDIVLSAKPAANDMVNVRIEVRDTGLGMMTVDVNRIFQPYQQARGDAAVRAKGTGLGLTICRRIVGLMGGTIGVKSKRGAGSEFFVDLNMHRADRMGLAERSKVDLNFEGVRVLVAEDDAVNRRIAERTLERLGCSVTLAVDGLDAVQQWSKDGPFDIVFMDCEMPMLDGFDATAEIRRNEADADNDDRQRIVAMTAHALRGAEERCLAAGMDGYITKPASKDCLAKILADVPPRPVLLDVGT